MENQDTNQNGLGDAQVTGAGQTNVQGFTEDQVDSGQGAESVQEDTEPKEDELDEDITDEEAHLLDEQEKKESLETEPEAEELESLEEESEQETVDVPEIDVAKYKITGLVDYFDEQGNIAGQFTRGSIQYLPKEVGDRAVEDGQAEMVQ